MNIFKTLVFALAFISSVFYLITISKQAILKKHESATITGVVMVLAWSLLYYLSIS